MGKSMVSFLDFPFNSSIESWKKRGTSWDFRMLHWRHGQLSWSERSRLDQPKEKVSRRSHGVSPQISQMVVFIGNMMSAIIFSKPKLIRPNHRTSDMFGNFHICCWYVVLISLNDATNCTELKTNYIKSSVVRRLRGLPFHCPRLTTILSIPVLNENIRGFISTLIIIRRFF